MKNWPIVCWQDEEPPRQNGITFVPICDPTTPVNDTFRHCPVDTVCEKDNVNWPTYDDLESALSVKTYDASPYDQTVFGSDASFQNRLEGVITVAMTPCISWL